MGQHCVDLGDLLGAQLISPAVERRAQRLLARKRFGKPGRLLDDSQGRIGVDLQILIANLDQSPPEDGPQIVETPIMGDPTQRAARRAAEPFVPIAFIRLDPQEAIWQWVLAPVHRPALDAAMAEHAGHGRVDTATDAEEQGIGKRLRKAIGDPDVGVALVREVARGDTGNLVPVEANEPRRCDIHGSRIDRHLIRRPEEATPLDRRGDLRVTVQDLAHPRRTRSAGTQDEDRRRPGRSPEPQLDAPDLCLDRVRSAVTQFSEQTPAQPRPMVTVGQTTVVPHGMSATETFDRSARRGVIAR